MRLNYVKILAAAAVVGYIAVGMYNGMTVRRYVYHSKKVKGSLRIVLVTDLHSCKYGEYEDALINAVDKLDPDIVCMSGDIFDDKLPDFNSACFLEQAARKYPCYYVTGNHEYWGGHEAFEQKMTYIEKYGVYRLCGESRIVEINGTKLNICGIDDRDAYLISNHIDGFRAYDDQLADAAETLSDEYLTILLSHRPEYFGLYRDFGFELVLAGHAHGGQWRIPGLLNGLVAPNQGLFPKYAGGVYQEDRTTMIVSRGLARESTRVPRFYNRPELVLVELTNER